MTSISSSVEIHAPAEVVWDVLTDTAAYPEWNPFLTRVDGPFVPGARRRIRFSPPGGRAMTMRPRVLVADAPGELRWRGRLGVPGLFDGEHVFTLAAIGAKSTRVVQHEEFRGILVPFTGSLLARTTRGFEAMNAALKARAESRAAQLPTSGAAARAATSTGSQSGDIGGA
jgi:hypothetical protein